MCQEFHCECCPDDLPLINCVCDGCYHGDEESIESETTPEHPGVVGATQDTRPGDDKSHEQNNVSSSCCDSTKNELGVHKVLANCCRTDEGSEVKTHQDDICTDNTEPASACQTNKKKPCCDDEKVNTTMEDAATVCEGCCSPEIACPETEAKKMSGQSQQCCSPEIACPETEAKKMSGQGKQCCSPEIACPETEAKKMSGQGKQCCSPEIACPETEAKKMSCQSQQCCSPEIACPETEAKKMSGQGKQCCSPEIACPETEAKKMSCQSQQCCSPEIACPETEAKKMSCQSQQCCSPEIACPETEAKKISGKQCCSLQNSCEEAAPKKTCCSSQGSSCEMQSKPDTEDTERGQDCCSPQDNENSETKLPSCCSTDQTSTMSAPNQQPDCCSSGQLTCNKEEEKSKCTSSKLDGEQNGRPEETKPSCCKDNEETTLLIEPSISQPIPANKAKLPTPRKNTTKLRVQNICCAMEAQLVQDCLKPLQGVESVAVNVIGRVVHVRHDPEVTSPTELVDRLNQVHLGATVMEMGMQNDKDQETLPRSLKLILFYVFLQSVLFITAVAALFLEQPWYKWVAIAEIVFGGVPIVKHALISVKNRRVDINILMLIAIIGTLAISEWVEGATVVFVFAFADALQEFCIFRVQRTISRLMLKRPEIAILVETGESVPIEKVDVGTLIAVRPGELIPLDGVVVKGRAAVDESSITGEALPVEKSVLSEVYSGTVNQNGYIEVETTSDSSSSTVSKVAQLVQEAQSSSTKTEAMINRFAKYYTPLVVLIAALLVAVPATLGAAGAGPYLQEIREWGRKALVMLVIACPCALVMASPIAVVCSITAAARKGALVKGGEHLETLAKLRVIAFDKTGTLTEGKFQVMNMESCFGENERDVLRLAASLESKSVHPIAAAIVNEFSGCVAEMVKNQVISLPEVSSFKMHEGQGVSGLIEGRFVRVGNREMVEQCGASLNPYLTSKYGTWSSESKTVVFVCVDEQVALVIALADAIRPNTSITLDWLRHIGVQTSMITGDNSRTAAAVKENLGLDDFVSEMKPHDKLKWIRDKQTGETCVTGQDNQSRTCCTKSRVQVMVGMVGDGINDGPALAAANVGIAMGAGGTALAVEAADVALMSNNLAKIPELITLAKFCNVIIKQNIVFSVLLKVVIVAVALGGYVTLWMAVVADAVGLLFVILNGLRPLAWKVQKFTGKPTLDIEIQQARRIKTVYHYESFV